jgi:NADH-quinone oxidoreductase subunit C
MSKAAALPYPTGRQRPSEKLAKELAQLATSLDGAVTETGTDVDIAVPPERLHTLIEALKTRSTLSFDFLRNILGLDFEAEGMALKYQLYSFKHGHAVQVTIATAAGHPHVRSLTDLYPAADWHEREASEMFGFVFDGHPNPKNLLLEEDLHIHPLLKAHPLQKAEIKQGIEEGPAGFKF